MSQLSHEQQLLNSLQQSATVIQRLKGQLKSYTEPIAIIGMGCRLPGGSDTPEQFWQLLSQGRDAVGPLPPTRQADSGETEPIASLGGFLRQVDGFEPEFFGISPREATTLDPQHRLLLEVSWEALESAGLVPERLFGSAAGIFVGLFNTDYAELLRRMRRPGEQDFYARVGSAPSMAAGRLAYTFGFVGPAVVVDTACSSSLVALHQACQSLRYRECNLALAGGVNLILTTDWATKDSTALERVFAPDGRCKTFDAAANGYGRGEGCGMVVLKRLADAQADGDPILAVIRGSMVNQDGRSSGLTAPSGPSQQTVIRRALQNAGLEPAQVGYIEAHGTGTSLGDPIEIGALNGVFGNRSEPLWVGSVKTNFGHLESAAGIASLLKVVLMLQHGQLPPHLHFQHPNPYIDWVGSPVQIPLTLTAWPTPAVNARGTGGRIAGISSFGLSGTNAHVIVEQAPTGEPRPTVGDRPCHLLTLSAKNEPALRALAHAYSEFLATTSADLGDLCYTAHTGRTHFAHRLSVTAASTDQLQTKLVAYGASELPGGISQGTVPGYTLASQVAFLFTGQGSQYVNMGRELYESEPTFRATLDRCDAILQAYLGESLLPVLYPDRETGRQEDSAAGEQSKIENPKSKIDETAYTQPALFALEYALAQLWRSWGVEPAVVLGHSVGEVVAACVAGVFSLEDALKLIAARGRLMGALPPDGAMVSLLADEVRVQAAVAPYQAVVSIAAVNGPASVVIAGKQEAVQAIVAQLAAEGVKTQPLKVSHAFHSPLMEPMLDAFRQVAKSLTYHQPTLPLISNITGQLAGAEVATPDYWVRHVRQTVRFADGVQTLAEQGCTIFLEIGPKPTLVGMAQAVLDLDAASQQSKIQNLKSKIYLPSLRSDKSAWQQILESLGALYVRGVAIDWQRFDQRYARRKVALPTYPFQRQRYWLNPHPIPPPAWGRGQGESLRPLIDKQTRLPLQKQTVFEKQVGVESLPFLADHLVFGEVVVPAAWYLSLALSGAELLFQGEPGNVQDVIFTQPLVLAPEEVRTVQLIVDEPTAAVASTPASFQLISFPAAATQTGEVLTHAAGSLHRWREPAPAIDLAALQARCHTALDPADLYATIAKAHIELGPTFRWFEQIWLGEHEALSRLQMPASITSVQGYRLFPSLIDACLQLAGLIADEQPARETLLAFSLDACVCYGPTDHQALWCHAHRQAERVWDFTLFTASGQVVAEFKGFQVHPAAASVVQGARLRTDWLYSTTWVQCPLAPTPHPASPPAAWLLFGAGELAATLASQLAAAAMPTVLAAPGDVYALTQQPDGAGVLHATVDPLDPEGFRQLLAGLAARHRSLGVVYVAEHDATAPAASIPDQSVHSCAALLHLVQALTDGEVAASLCLVTQGCQVVTGVQPAGAATDAEVLGQRVVGGALWGLARTIALELPQVQCRAIDVEDASAASALLLHSELLRGPGASSEPMETQVAYRQGVRYAARLTRQPFTAASNRATTTQPLRIEAEATYLITGGVGSLGLQAAHQLVAMGARHLVLTSRRGVSSAEARTALAAWAEQGLDIQVVNADSADPADVQRVLAHCQQIAPLRGIIHVAGVMEFGVLAQQSLARLVQTLRPKVHGAWYLHTLTQGMALDFFVGYSSLAATLGLPGQGSYNAANAFLDALMQQRALGGQPGLSINWGPWAEVGPAADRQTQLRALGLTMITPAEGNALLRFLLHQAEGVVAVVTLDREQFFKLHAGARSAYYASLQPLRPQPKTDRQPAISQQQLLAAPAQERTTLVTTYLAAQVAGITGLQAAQLDLAHSFLAVGMDSLMVVELRNRITQDLALTLPISRLLDEGAMSDLVTYILEQIDSAPVLQELATAQPVALPYQHNGGHNGQPPLFDEQKTGLDLRIAFPGSGQLQEIEGEL